MKHKLNIFNLRGNTIFYSKTTKYIIKYKLLKTKTTNIGGILHEVIVS